MYNITIRGDIPDGYRTEDGASDEWTALIESISAGAEGEAGETLIPKETTEPGGGETTEPGGGETTEPGGGETTEPGGGETTEPGGGETTEPGGGETTEPGDGGKLQSPEMEKLQSPEVKLIQVTERSSSLGSGSGCVYLYHCSADRAAEPEKGKKIPVSSSCMRNGGNAPARNRAACKSGGTGRGYFDRTVRGRLKDDHCGRKGSYIDGLRLLIRQKQRNRSRKKIHHCLMRDMNLSGRTSLTGIL